MKELMAELLECTCIQQGREALAEQIITAHFVQHQAQAVAEYASALAAEPVEQVVIGGTQQNAENGENSGDSSTN